MIKSKIALLVVVVVVLLVVANFVSSYHRYRTRTRKQDELLIRDALAHVPHGKGWYPEDTEVLKSITLPRWQAKYGGGASSSEIDRLGDIWLPPRLPIADDIRTLEYGVLFCGSGPMKFAKNGIVPTIQYYRQTLGIRDASERAALRKKGVYSGGSRQGFALVAKRAFIEEDGPLKDVVSFFDAVYFVEDLPKYSFEWKNQTNSTALIKATKVHTMASAPFDTTIMLDFDSFPCQPDFGLPLLEIFRNSDIGFANVVSEMGYVKDSRHFLGEHSSAVVVLNMKSIRTRLLLALYIQAFHLQGELEFVQKGRSRGQRDQPALKVALQAMAESFQTKDGQLLGIPNDSVRDVISKHNLGFIQHSDFNPLVCRPLTHKGTKGECSQDSSCVIAHKKMPQQQDLPEAVAAEPTIKLKLFGIGFKKTGTTSLDSIFHYVMDHMGGSRPPDSERVRAMNNLMRGEDPTGALTLAEKHHYFQDSPWCNEPQRLYRQLVSIYPTSKFILTVREPNKWYNSVRESNKCPSKNGKICGERKMKKYRDIFNANSTSREDFISAFEEHNLAIRDFFLRELKQPDRLLEIDLTDEKYRDGVGWAIVCDFVGLSMQQCPTQDFPHENKSKSHRGKSMEKAPLNSSSNYT